MVLNEEWRVEWKTTGDRNWTFGFQGAEVPAKEAANSVFDHHAITHVRLLKITTEVIRERKK